MANRWEVRGGFGPNHIICKDNLVDWFKAENEKNLRERDPTLRGFLNLQLTISANALPPVPVTDEEMSEVEKFPFSQIANLAPPNKHSQVINQILSQNETNETLSAADQNELVTLCGIKAADAERFCKYIKGEIQSF